MKRRKTIVGIALALVLLSGCASSDVEVSDTIVTTNASQEVNTESADEIQTEQETGNGRR